MSYANQFERFTAGGATFTNNALGVGAEQTGSGTSYYRRDNEGGLVSERLPSGAIYYYAFDGLGSVSALTDTAGTAQALYSYEPYGETTASGPAPATANPWRYASSYLDSTGFYKMGMRYYRPELMRWSQQDPLEQPTDPTQAMRYGYVGGNPINATDPNGDIRCWGRCSTRNLKRLGYAAVGTVALAGGVVLTGTAVLSGRACVTGNFHFCPLAGGSTLAAGGALYASYESYRRALR